MSRSSFGGSSNSSSHRRASITRRPAPASDTVGSLLAAIATALNDGLRIMHFADKRGWGPDEFEQVRALDEALDEAKADFQAMAPLVSGQFFYETDRTPASLDELRLLRAKFDSHIRLFKDWLRTGGPINPGWVLETGELRRELHRAQCRAACRIFATGPGPARCLGAFRVSRHQRQMERRRAAADRAAESESMLRVPGDVELGLQPQVVVTPDGEERWRHEGGPSANPSPPDDPIDARRDGLDALVPMCNAVGSFERFGDRDVAFVCDYCDGFLVWEDLQEMPSTRDPPTTSAAAAAAAPSSSSPARPDRPEWQATARASSSSEPKEIVFAPVAIANHMLPDVGDWHARVLCPYCDEYTYVADGDDAAAESRYAQDERGFADIGAFQEHLEWYHAGGVVPLPTAVTKKENCIVM